MNRIILFAASCALVAIIGAQDFDHSINAQRVVAPQATSNDIALEGFFATDKAQRGQTLHAAVVLDIPKELHINANRTADENLIPTVLYVEAPRGVRVHSIKYPAHTARKFGFSDEPLNVYEGRTVLRFSFNVPSNFSPGVMDLKARVRLQSCNERECFPPTTREVKMSIAVVAATETVKPINPNLFGVTTNNSRAKP